jgi:transposase
MKLYAGIDLHSSNNYLAILRSDGKRIFGKRLPNCIETIRSTLKPFKKHLCGIAVESTYNWYWLVDSLKEDGYKMHLANPSAIQQYEGLKHTDDKWDAFWLAHMLKLGILPQGYIYPKDRRPIRDLMRRRMTYVNQRTTHVLSLQSLLNRHLAMRVNGNEIKKLKPTDIDKLIKDPFLSFTAQNNIATICFLETRAKEIEKKIFSMAKLEKQFEVITSMPGIGKVLGLTIMLEVDNINRFAAPGNYLNVSPN